MDVVVAFWQLFQVSAPWLLLGLFIAGWLNVYMPASFLNKHLGDNRVFTVVKAALIGAPLPLCSCGVIPAAVGLRRAGASNAATTSFLVATPETGVDSVSMSYALLGPFMAIVRPIAAIFSAIMTGILTMLVDTGDKPAPQTEVKSCCGSSKKATPEPVAKWQQILRFSFVDMIKDVAKWLVIGLAVAAVITVYVPDAWLSEYGNGLGAMIVMVLIGIPMYICATASTPIAAGLLLSGISPGAVLVFMLAGPATNIATIGVVKSEMGTRTALMYTLGVISSAILSGLFVDWLVQYWGISISASHMSSHEVLPDWLVLTSSIALLLMLANVFVVKPLRARFA